MKMLVELVGAKQRGTKLCFSLYPCSVLDLVRFGAKAMIPYIKELSDKAPFFVSAYPNAGLPNEMGERMMRDHLKWLLILMISQQEKKL